MISLYSSLYFNCYFHLDTAPIPPAKRFPEISDLDIKSKPFCKHLVQDIKILLMTATLNELRGIMGYLKPKDDKKKIIETSIKGKKVYIGKYGQYPVVVGMSAPDKTQQGPLDACTVTTMIMMAIELRYVIAVGICYGMDESKTSSGDVIVSSVICDCTCLRVGETKKGEYSFTRRKKEPSAREEPSLGKEPSLGQTLLKFFHPGTPNNYSHTRAGKEVQVHFGPIIARPDLVDNSEYKKKLKELSPEALGGEMEGAGIMAAIEKVYNNRAEAIVIKAICDWGNGKKSEAADWKPFSSHAAARYVYHKMKNSTKDFDCKTTFETCNCLHSLNCTFNA